MDISALVGSYGYLAVLVLSFLAGEGALVTCAILAQQGSLQAPVVALCAFAGGLANDQFLFHLARHKGVPILRRYPRLAGRMEAFALTMRRHKRMILIFFPFLYGLRSAAAIFLGLNRTDPRLFLLSNILGSALWAVAYTTLGFFFGRVLTRLLDGVGRYGPLLVIAAIALGAGLWLYGRYRLRKRTKR